MAVATLAVSGLTFTAVSASAASGTVATAGAALTVRTGPGVSYAVAGKVADGARITISCQTAGSKVSGTYGTTTIWDKIGTGRFVSDAYVYTGSDGRVAPGLQRHRHQPVGQGHRHHRRGAEDDRQVPLLVGWRQLPRCDEGDLLQPQRDRRLPAPSASTARG